MTPKTTKFPWDNLSIPTSPGEYVARLVPKDANPSGRRLFWARGWMEHPAFIVEYKCNPWKPISIPTFKNLLVADHREESSLVIELLDLDMSDIFLKVCLDIISALQDMPSKACRKAAMLRLERWSSFLRPSRAKMSPEAQKGLIAELRFLQRDMLVAHEPEDALNGWTGPDSGPRDFAYGQVFVEVKSKRGSANPNIIISSEEQLNVNPTEHLFLYVAELNDAPLDDEDSFTITDVVIETRDTLESPLLQAALDSKLANVGYFDEDDYSDAKWSEGDTYYYAVIGDFPKIDSRSCSPGVNKVCYQIDLDYCEDYLVERSAVLESME